MFPSHDPLGDLSELTSVNSYQHAKKGGRPDPERMQDELIREAYFSQKYLDEIEGVVGKKCQKVFIQGNHELWIDNMFLENKHTDPKFRPENLLGLHRRKYTYYKHGQWIKMGKVYLNHGTQAKGVNHPRLMLQRHGKNIIYGHTHDLMKHTVPTLGGAYTARS